MIGQLIRKTLATVASWFDDGSGAINTPWNDSNNWTE